MIISSFHTGPDQNRNIHSHYEKGLVERIEIDIMFPYRSLHSFYLGLAIDVIGLAFYISFLIWDPIDLVRLLLNGKIGLIIHLFNIFDLIYKISFR